MAIPTPSACRALARLLLAALLAAAAGCGGREAGSAPPRHDGPIVLITLEGLRSDVMGAFGAAHSATPNLDRLAARATWAGRAIAPSSWVVPSAATLLTGVRPWEHRAISALERSLEPRFVTLAEAMGELGYRSRAYLSCTELRPAYGFAQGFESVLTMRRGARASADLRALTGGRELLWMHLELPSPPYVRREALGAGLPPPPPGLPRRAGGTEIEVYFDPAVPLPAARREQLWALYLYNVAAADAMVGRLLGELDASGQRDQTLLVVASLFGQELGEHGQIGQGGNLGRALIEVPLLISLPRAFPRPVVPPPTERVALSRLWATLVEAAGGQAPPGVAPSLFGPAPREVLSELYLAAGHNELSLVDGDEQLRWVAPFADPGDDFFALRLAAIGASRDGAERHAFRQRLESLDRLFRATRPLAGDGSPPRLLLERWTAGGVERLEDPARAAVLARRLAVDFSLFVESSS
jgi:arylsulfatase A-like enzyme